uniref:Transposase (Putative), gypsy type n=1 Tax=Tanacetum cinerariifolium TaxID=118510 RepID=A0A6L2K3B4_TANCI|nr:hypothetical protein [Tanacetum cinerariifolium]
MLAIQRCEFSRKELNEFLSSYFIPSEYRVILPTLTQTILDAPPGLNPFGYSKLTTFIVMCKAYDFEPSVELFRGFFNLCKAGWHQRFFFIQDAIVPSKFPSLFLKENMLDVKSFKDKLPSEMSFRKFIYTKDDEDLTFLPKDFSPGFNTGSRFVSINMKPVRADEKPAVEPATEPGNKRVRTTANLGGSPKGDTFIVYARSVAARIKERKCKIRGGYLRSPIKRKLAFVSSTSRAVHAKASIIKDDTPGFLDNHLDVDLLDLRERFYTRQVVVDNAVNRRSRELLEVIEKLRGEADVMRARELAREEEYEGLQAKCEVSMTDFDKNPAVLLLQEKMSSLAVEAKEHKGNLDRLMLKSQRWSGYQATKASLHQEIEEVKHDRREVVSKVVPYACMELLHSDELGRLVGKLVSSAITFEYVVDASASVEAFLLKKPPH